LGLVCFSLQIYGDFAGYSLIAIGLAQIFGYKLPENFARPYFATGMRDFWRRWHISLSSWFRDYVYRPLGGSGSHGLRVRNVVVTMLISGLWHGANWTFLLWGALHAGLMLMEDGLRWLGARSRVRLTGISLHAGRLFLTGLVFAAVTLTWLPFRADTLHTVWSILSIIGDGDFSLPRGMQQASSLVRVALFGLIVLAVDGLIEWGGGRRYAGIPVVVRSMACSFLIVMLLLFGSFESHSFIYFKF
jgi:D-alanyl-lipoteichoic acid acyltransferase DltB (MBOAT superfamily)